MSFDGTVMFTGVIYGGLYVATNFESAPTPMSSSASALSMLYSVNYLFPGAWYFKVRGQNSCMPGEWSKSVRTQIF